MKVRASVKKICRNCKIVKAQRRRARDLQGRAPQAAPGLSSGPAFSRATARSRFGAPFPSRAVQALESGVAWPVSPASTFPTTSTQWVSLTTSTASAARRARKPSARRSASKTGHARVIGPHRGELDKLRNEVAKLHRRGRPAPRGVDEHQAPDGPRLLPRHPPSPRPAGARPAHAHQRAHPQGSAAHQDQAQGPTRDADRDGQARRRRSKKKVKAQRERRRRARPRVVQQHDHHDHRPPGQRAGLGDGRRLAASAARARARPSPRRSPPSGRRTRRSSSA